MEWITPPVVVGGARHARFAAEQGAAPSLPIHARARAKLSLARRHFGVRKTEAKFEKYDAFVLCFSSSRHAILLAY